MVAKRSTGAMVNVACLLVALLSALPSRANARELKTSTTQGLEYEDAAGASHAMPLADELAAAEGAQVSSTAGMPVHPAAAAMAAATKNSIVWVNRTGYEEGRCNVTCLEAGLALYNESGWVSVGAPNASATQLGQMGSLCRKFYNNKYYTGFTGSSYDASGNKVRGCYFAMDPDSAAGTPGLGAFGISHECACDRKYIVGTNGIWKKSKVCNCKSGCACGGFFPASKSDYTGFYAIGVVQKGAASKCSVNDPLGSGNNWYYQIKTMHIGGCAGRN